MAVEGTFVMPTIETNNLRLVVTCKFLAASLMSVQEQRDNGDSPTRLSRRLALDTYEVDVQSVESAQSAQSACMSS